MARDTFDIASEWQIAQIKILETVITQSLDGISKTDEDLVDSWEAKIPTKVKLDYSLLDRQGKVIWFIEEWDKINAAIDKDETESAMRKRILKKSQLIIDLLHEIKTWMKQFSETEPSVGGKFYDKFPKKVQDE